MTKGEEQAYAIIRSSLGSLISTVRCYCRDYDCGNELLRECEEAEEALSESRRLFMKGKRKNGRN